MSDTPAQSGLPANADALIYYTAASQHTVTALLARPHTLRTPIPFNANKWPSAGHFYASPDLNSSEIHELSNKFGTFEGYLPEGRGLPSTKSSRIVLANPKTVSGLSPTCFGCSKTSVDPGFFPPTQLSTTASYAGLVCSFIIPSLILLGTVTLAWRKKQDHATHILETLGATPQSLHLSLFRSLITPWSAGAIGSIPILLILFLFDIPIPFFTFTIRRIDVLGVWWAFLFAFFAAAMTSALVILMCTYPRKPRFTPAGIRDTRITTSSKVLGFIGLFIPPIASTIVLNDFINASYTDASNANYALFWIGIIGTLLAIPFTARFLIHLSSRIILRFGRCKASASMIVVGRTLSSSSQIVRSLSTGSILILVTTTLAILSLLTWLPAGQVQRTINFVDSSYVQIAIPQNASIAELARLEKTLSKYSVMELATFLPTNDNEKSKLKYTLSATPNSFKKWHLESGKSTSVTSLPPKLAVMFPDDQVVTVRTVSSIKDAGLSAEAKENLPASFSWIVSKQSGSRVDKSEITKIVSATLGPVCNVYVGGEEWIAGANDTLFQHRWLHLCAIVSSVILLVAILITATRDIEDFNARLIPIQKAYASTSTVRKSIWLRTCLLGLLTVLIGGGASICFARCIEDNRLNTVGGIYPVIAAICALMVLTLLLFTSLSSQHHRGKKHFSTIYIPKT
ncbi:hypothetical protein QS713_02270 [Gleimia hominis]|uniref:ABC3 transporter permease protein domain-containing protein n=1 Tax=Gleimia hominis TaxID=595468 RepID=A0ABU3I936_9ACTO|nr:hypothetical protein [Gleimia hominis]MDT3766890.1 hypothetical protein [Gleimia hominis]